MGVRGKKRICYHNRRRRVYILLHCGRRSVKLVRRTHVPFRIIITYYYYTLIQTTNYETLSRACVSKTLYTRSALQYYTIVILWQYYRALLIRRTFGFCQNIMLYTYLNAYLMYTHKRCCVFFYTYQRTIIFVLPLNRCHFSLREK